MRFFCLSFREGTFPTVAFPRSDGVPGTGVTEEPGTVGVGGTDGCPVVPGWVSSPVPKSPVVSVYFLAPLVSGARARSLPLSR